MTSAEYKNLVKSVPVMTSLFAAGAQGEGLVRTPTFVQSAPSSDGQIDSGYGICNFKTGFPVNPYATNKSDGGKCVLIGDVNGMAKEATKGLYLLQNGGTNEFSQSVSDNDIAGGVSDGGYPFKAVIDWWDESAEDRYEQNGMYRKVICVKSGGNCTVGPDDAVHGVNGSGTRYWEIVDTYPQTTVELIKTTFGDTSFVTSNGASIPTYTFKIPGRIAVTISCIATNAHNKTTVNRFAMNIEVGAGDTLYANGGSSATVSLNGKKYTLTASDIVRYTPYSMSFGVSMVPWKYKIS